MGRVLAIVCNCGEAVVPKGNGHSDVLRWPQASSDIAMTNQLLGCFSKLAWPIAKCFG